MAEKESWRETVDKLLAAGELRVYSEEISDLLDIIEALEMPSGKYADAMGVIIKDTSIELPRLEAIYLGVMLGMAYEKLQNKVE